VAVEAAVRTAALGEVEEPEALGEVEEPEALGEVEEPGARRAGEPGALGCSKGFSPRIGFWHCAIRHHDVSARRDLSSPRLSRSTD
jgi:hypothetical protein